ncbi:MAG: hypothetical protein MJZ05_05870 [Fibrobacter sp.]|nr:hypothetical protein [Fibrobacter sp.]
MSDSANNITISGSNRSIVHGFVGVVTLVAFLLILPLYMQNRLTRLYEKSHDLTKQVSLLNRQILLQELEINKLTSLENLSVFAEEAGYDLNSVPTKVRLSGGSK